MLESSEVIAQFPVVVPEHLFVEIPEQVEGLHAHVSPFEPALEQAPEVFESVSVDSAIHVLLGVVNDFVGVIRRESLIGHERVGINGTASRNMLSDFCLEG